MRIFLFLFAIYLQFSTVDSCLAFFKSSWYQERKVKFSLSHASDTCKAIYYTWMTSYSPRKRNLCNLGRRHQKKLAPYVTDDQIFVVRWYCSYVCHRAHCRRYKRIFCYSPQKGTKKTNPSEVHINCKCGRRCVAGGDNFLQIEALYDRECLNAGPLPTHPPKPGIKYLYETKYWSKNLSKWQFGTAADLCKAAINDFKASAVAFAGNACEMSNVRSPITAYYCYKRCASVQNTYGPTHRVASIECTNLKSIHHFSAILHCTCRLYHGNNVVMDNLDVSWSKVVNDWEQGCKDYQPQATTLATQPPTTPATTETTSSVTATKSVITTPPLIICGENEHLDEGKGHPSCDDICGVTTDRTECRYVKNTRGCLCNSGYRRDGRNKCVRSTECGFFNLTCNNGHKGLITCSWPAIIGAEAYGITVWDNYIGIRSYVVPVTVNSINFDATDADYDFTIVVKVFRKNLFTKDYFGENAGDYTLNRPYVRHLLGDKKTNAWVDAVVDLSNWKAEVELGSSAGLSTTAVGASYTYHEDDHQRGNPVYSPRGDQVLLDKVANIVISIESLPQKDNTCPTVSGDEPRSCHSGQKCTFKLTLELDYVDCV